MKKAVLFCIMLLPLFTVAQKKGTEYTDSLLALLPKAKEDSNKAILLNKIGAGFSSFDLDKTKLYAQQGLSLSEKIKWNKGISTFLYLVGTVFMSNGSYDSAVFYYTKSYELDIKIKDEHGQVADLINLGLTEATRGNTVKAMEYLTNAIPIGEKVKDTIYLALIYNNISNIHFFNKNYVAAKDVTVKALTLARASKNDEAIASALSTLATIYHEQKDTVIAMKYYNEALAIYLQNKNKLKEAALLGNIGILQKNKFDAINLKLKAKTIWDTLSPSFTDAIKNTGNLGLDYLDLVMDTSEKYVSKNELNKNKSTWILNAEKYLKNAVDLAKQSGNIEWYWTYAANLSTLFKQKNDYKNALYYLEQSTSTHDSLYSQENKNKIAALESKREIDLKNKEIELKNEALSNQRKQRIALFAGLFLLAIIGVLLLRLNRIRKKSNTTLTALNKQLDSANKLKAKFFAILSHDLRTPVANLVTYLTIKDDNPTNISVEENVRFQKNIKQSAEALLNNMDEVLLWSKGQMDNFKPDLRKVNTGEIFEKLKIIHHAEKNISINFINEENITLVTDENYLLTIMQNLTTNAFKNLKYRNDGEVTWSVNQVHGITTFFIADNGTGISAEQAKALFEDAVVNNSKTGFGMHLIRDLAKAINCNITLHKTDETGTVFKLQFS